MADDAGAGRAARAVRGESRSRIIFIELMTLDRKLKASREGSKSRIYGPSKPTRRRARRGLFHLFSGAVQRPSPPHQMMRGRDALRGQYDELQTHTHTRTHTHAHTGTYKLSLCLSHTHIHTHTHTQTDRQTDRHTHR